MATVHMRSFVAPAVDPRLFDRQGVIRTYSTDLAARRIGR
jgi:hypothetical protein